MQASMQASVQAMTTIRIAATLTAIFFSACLSAQIHLAEPQITSSADGAVTYEIALRTPLPEGSTAQLASMQIHKAKGFPYPLWLSDAHIDVKQRAGQRQTLRIQAQRPSPFDQHEIMLAFTSNGNTRFVPYALQSDTGLRRGEGSPMPSPPVETELLANPLEAIANGIIRNTAATPLQTQPKQSEPITNSPSFSTRTPTQTKQNQHLKRFVSARNATATAPAAVVLPVAAASEPVAIASAPLDTLSAPIVTASAFTPTPAATAPRPPAPTLASKMLQGTLAWALGAVAALLLLYILMRLWIKNRNKSRSNAPVLTRETQFQATDRGGAANTVFGLSDSEAVAMQQQWQQQMLKKS